MVTINPYASGCPAPQYQYWLRYPNGTWHLGRGYATGSWAWNTAGLATGAYSVTVWARDLSSAGTKGNSAGRYDAYGTMSYTLTAGCPGLAVWTTPLTAKRGTTVNLTASAHGCASSTPLYQFWVLYPGQTAWRQVRAYSTDPQFNWSTSGLPVGTYRFSVWVKNSTAPGVHGSANGGYDAYAVIPYKVT